MALILIFVTVWSSLALYDVSRSIVARNFRETFRETFPWLERVARQDERAGFHEWVSETCEKPHLQESLICQATIMDSRVGARVRGGLCAVVLACALASIAVRKKRIKAVCMAPEFY